MTKTVVVANFIVLLFPCIVCCFFFGQNDDSSGSAKAKETSQSQSMDTSFTGGFRGSQADAPKIVITGTKPQMAPKDPSETASKPETRPKKSTDEDDKEPDISDMFKSMTKLLMEDFETRQLNSGVAVADVDYDGEFEFIIANRNGANLVLKFNRQKKKLKNIATRGSRFEPLMDPQGEAISVAACDLDGDGKEEIYFLNTNGARDGKTHFNDKLFKWKHGEFIDLYHEKVNWHMATKEFAGHSVSCIDRKGTGKYGFVIAASARKSEGTIALVELDEAHPEKNLDTEKIVVPLQNSARWAEIDNATGARGLVVGPILSRGAIQDIYITTDGDYFMKRIGRNLLFQYTKYGKFKEVAEEYGLQDEKNYGRGIALADFNHDGLMDLVYGNSKGPNRFYIQMYEDENVTSNNTDKEVNAVKEGEKAEPEAHRTPMPEKNQQKATEEKIFNNDKTKKRAKTYKKKSSKKKKKQKKSKKQKKEEEVVKERKRKFVDIATDEFKQPCLVRNVLAADFDNDGNLEVFLNTMKDVNKKQPNKLFTVVPQEPGKMPEIFEIGIGDAEEERGRGTGAAVMDLNGDGRLELLISHGESQIQQIDLYKVVPGKKNNWIRVFVKTQNGAPARGAVVKVTTNSSIIRTSIIDNGSGYLCQMEPVAHFGLGTDEAVLIYVEWPDGSSTFRIGADVVQRTVHVIEHPERDNYNKRFERVEL